MKSFINHIGRATMFAAMLAVAGGAVSAQNAESGFFTDGYTYRYQMNPAIANDKGFVSMPALGNLNFDVNGTLHASTLLWNVNGKTTTFLNPGVGEAEFLKKIKDKQGIALNLRETILAAGFKAFGGYNTIGISARADVGVNAPGELFRMLKQGITNKNYDIANFGARANAWAEIQLGHSRDLGMFVPGLRAGVNLKVLVGAANLDAKFNRANLVLGTDSWNIEADAEINASFKGQYKTDYNDRTNRHYVSGADFNNPGVGGFGLAFDLGAQYRLNPDWQFSLSLTDLGFISWSETQTASTNGLQTVQTSDYIFNVDDDAPNSFSNEFDRMKDQLSYIYELQDMGNTGGRTTALGATLYAGAEYTFPLYRNLTFGLLNTTRMAGDYSWTNFRLSANVAPVKVFSAGVNVAYGTYGAAFGCILNLHVPGFNLFLAADHMPGKLAKQGIPLSSNAGVNLGLNFLF